MWVICFILKSVPLFLNSRTCGGWEHALSFVSIHGCRENEKEGNGKHNNNNEPCNGGSNTSTMWRIFSVFPNDIGWFGSTSDLDGFS